MKYMFSFLIHLMLSYLQNILLASKALLTHCVYKSGTEYIISVLE